MNIESKPPELLQAQVALYAENQSEFDTPGRERALLARIGETALYSAGAPDEVTYPLSTNIRKFVDGEITTIAAKGEHRPMFDREEYADFLKDPKNRETSRHLGELIGAYEEVAPLIDDMGIVGLDLAQAREHPNFLAHGGHNMAFRFSGVIDGQEKQMVALFAQNPDNPHIQSIVNSRAINLATAKGLDGFEQGVAVSYDPPVVVAEMALGKDMASMSHEERQKIPQEHWEKLMDNVMNATERGIAIDANTDNFIYDPDKGFTVIDFRLRSKTKPLKEAREAEVKAINGFREEMLTQAVIARN